MRGKSSRKWLNAARKKIIEHYIRCRNIGEYFKMAKKKNSVFKINSKPYATFYLN